MKINIDYSLEVQAKAEKLWEILTDVESWPNWQGTPFVKLSKWAFTGYIPPSAIK